MKVQTQVQTVERIGIDASDESTFGLAVTAEAFEILSAGIYTDPILAVIRELSCNAYDSHVAAGKKDEPFELHLPNRIEPWFSVKDNGIGLSDESIRGEVNPDTGRRENGLFITYFDSTKRMTNDEIGAKGLGSKSPFAYSETFEVIARYNGVRRTYSVFRNEEMIPSITLLSEIDTDECNGVEIKMTVREQDWNRFADKTADILKYFPTKPEVKGVARFQFSELPDNRFEGDGYFTVSGYRYDSDKFTAVMGHVPYRVDVSKVKDQLTGAEVEFLDNYKIVAFFSIGELETAASREEIRYDKRSVANLCEMIRTARTDFIEKTDEEMVALTKDINDRWEAYRILNDKFESVSNLEDIASGYKWTADVVNEWVESNGSISFMTPDYHTMLAYVHGRTRAVRKKDYTKNSVPHSADVVPSMMQPKVVIMDVRVRSSLRLNQYLDTLDDNKYHATIAITPIREKAIQERQPNLKKIDYKKDLKDLLDSLGNPEVVKLSEVSTDVKVAYAGRRTTGLTFNRFCADSRPNNQHNRRPVFADTTAPDDPKDDHQHLYLLVETTSKKMCLRNGEVLDWSHYDAKRKVHSMVNIINAVKGTEYKASELFGLTKKVVKHVKDNADWVNLFDLFEEVSNEMEHVYEYFANKNATGRDGGIKDMVFHPRFVSLAEKLSDDSLLKTTLLPIAEADVEMQKELDVLDEDKISEIRILGRQVMFEGHDNVPEPTALFDAKDILNHYPMLKHISYNIMGEAEDVFDYIALVDSQI